jgi:spermidine synthase
MPTGYTIRSPTPYNVPRRRGDHDFLIVIGGRVLMTSAARRSEEALAELACAALRERAAPRVLVGGLGMGFTLRAALEVLPPGARVVVAELHERIVSWCRGPLAVLTAGAVLDRRVETLVSDVGAVIGAAPPGSFDAIVLDLYAGPYPSTGGDPPVYRPAALARAHRALSPAGVLTIWAEDEDPAFLPLLTAAGFAARVQRVGRGGRRHVVYFGQVGPVGQRR